MAVETLSYALDATFAFVGGLVGAAGTWSLKARTERSRLDKRIRDTIAELEAGVEQAYKAIIDGDHGKGSASRRVLAQQTAFLLAALERREMVFSLSEKQDVAASRVLPLLDVFPALGEFAERFTASPPKDSNGKNKFAALLRIGSSDAVVTLCSVPSVLRRIRAELSMKPLDEALTAQQKKSVEVVSKRRHALDTEETRDLDIFLRRT